MCRFVAYVGDPLFLDEIVCRPRHSLVRQALHAERARTVTNGDGFGIGWYGERLEPAAYREVMPAWSDENLMSLCQNVRSRLFFAHVRAATGTAIARHNSHPFRYGRHMFMHNGQIGGYPLLRRALEQRLPDPFYTARKGATDSELMFLLAMSRTSRAVPADQAMIEVVRDTIRMMRAREIAEPMRFAAALSDGASLWAFRIASDDDPPSLFFRQGSRGTAVASEPFDDAGDRWEAIPSGAVLRIGPDRRIEMRPAIDDQRLPSAKPMLAAGMPA